MPIPVGRASPEAKMNQVSVVLEDPTVVKSAVAAASSSSAPAMTFRECAVGSVREAMIAYLYCHRSGTPALDMLTETVNVWVDQVNSGAGSMRTTMAAARGQQMPDSDEAIASATCPICRCFFHEPITLPNCGHTFCRRCLMLKSDDLQQQQQLQQVACIRCRAISGRDRTTSTIASASTYRVNVVAANVLQKWWPRHAEAVRLKHIGNDLLDENDVAGAIDRYNQAYELDQNDAVLLSNRSYTLLNTGKSEEALADAEAAVSMRPDWYKGYFRKGAALLSLGRYEDAAVAYLQCLVLEPANPTMVIEAVKVLHKFLSMLSVARSTSDNLARIRSAVKHAWDAHHEHKSLSGVDGEEYGCTDRTTKRTRLDSPCDVTLGTKESERLSRFLDRCHYEMERTKKAESRAAVVVVDRLAAENAINKEDLECTLCYRLFWEPVTTSCGHVFCRSCLDRCLDHFARCPLCKASLEDYLAQRQKVITEFLDCVMKKYIPQDYAERKKDHEDELNDLARMGHGEHSEMPIFVCTVGFPTICCPLHVFEPRYRLLIRRCMESGARRFGMCAALDGTSEEFASYGTELEVCNVQYLPDGRSIVDTIGRSRFRVLQRGMKDGYHTAKVESLRDRVDDSNETVVLHDSVLRQATAWFASLSMSVRDRIVRHFGSMPDTEDGYPSSPEGPAWAWWTLAVLPLDQRAQLAILATKSLKKRLEALKRTLDHIRSPTSTAADASADVSSTLWEHES